jgi:anti-sigma regulatory factor (Ser/Thr protein kinase)
LRNLSRDGGTLVACLEDTGCEFDPTQFPPRSVAKSLEEAKVGDLGIHLMRSFASSMHYERRDGRNRLTMRFVEASPFTFNPTADPRIKPDLRRQ